MENGKKYPEAKGEIQNNILLTFGELVSTFAIEFVVDCGASVHMISKKDLNSAELETVTTSRSPMTVITANGEVQTNEEATVFVRELDIFLTMKTPRGHASSSIAGKALR